MTYIAHSITLINYTYQFHVAIATYIQGILTVYLQIMRWLSIDYSTENSRLSSEKDLFRHVD